MSIVTYMKLLYNVYLDELAGSVIAGAKKEEKNVITNQLVSNICDFPPKPIYPGNYSHISH